MPLDLPITSLVSAAAGPAAPIVVPVRVAIVARDALVHAALRARLATTEDVWLVDDPARASVLIWDPPPFASGELPTLPTLDTPGGPALVIAVVDESTDPMPLLAAGVRGLLRRNTDGQRLRATILAAELGLTVLDEDPADALVAAWSPLERTPTTELDRLTPREREVLELLADGLSNRSIAEKLGISAHTVKFHVDALLDKLSARSRTQVVVKAVRQGLLELV
jgi:DNA-binding NarL/FixJ family response regulator